jgi:hypothetical protein
MLEIRYISDNIIEIKESIFSFYNTKVSYYYYDIINWIRYYNRPVSKPMTVELINSNPTPDKKYHEIEKMTQSSIDWAKKYYLPKAKKE